MLKFCGGFKNRFRVWKYQCGKFMGFLSVLILFLPLESWADCSLASPTNYTILPHSSPTFKWKAQCGGTNYTLSLYRSNWDLVQQYNIQCDADECEFYPNLDLSNGIYFWNIAMDGTENYVGNGTAVFSVWASKTYYRDNDKDGFGNPSSSLNSYIWPIGYVLDDTDCDDHNASVHKGALEICGDGIDQDCNGSDQGCTEDKDKDGWRPDAGDCNDNDASIHPNAPEICGDNIDQDCDGITQTCQELACVDISNVPLETQY